MRDRFRMVGRAVALLALAGGLTAANQCQSVPRRLFSTGDSITRAFDANLPADNLNLSWVNGYHGFWEEFFGLPNVKSHNQRIDAVWGTSGRTNTIGAQNGARVDDLVAQASGAAGRDITYATVMLGGNDVCRDTIADLPTDAQFEADFTAGMDALLANLADGATVQVVAIPDVKRLYDVGIDKTALGITDCQTLWQLTVLGFPCGSMLSPSNTEADRLYVRQRNIGYNNILASVTAQKAAQHPKKFISYTDVTFTYPFQSGDISDIDCFHPSASGERLIAKGTWDSGFFAVNQQGS
jgi:lysophospholipase L1-like esterase